MSLLEIRSWATATRGAPVIRCDSFTLKAGEIVSLEGRSGAGKSLFIRSLVGLEPVDQCSFLRKVESWALRRRQIQLIPQHPVLAEGTVRDALIEPFQWNSTHRLAAGQIEPAALEELRSLGFPDPRGTLAQATSSLSGGERARVALARSLLMDPSVLLLDEPTAGLDEQAALLSEGRLRGWVDQGPSRAILFTSHDSRQRDRLARRRLVLLDEVVREISREGGEASHSVLGTFGGGPL